jgi:hypothetical protein
LAPKLRVRTSDPISIKEIKNGRILNGGKNKMFAVTLMPGITPNHLSSGFDLQL